MRRRLYSVFKMNRKCRPIGRDYGIQLKPQHPTAEPLLHAEKKFYLKLI